MAMKTRLSAVFGLLAGGMAGFITRDDYSFPSEQKIIDIAKDF